MTRREKVLLGLMSMTILCAVAERSFSERSLFGIADTQSGEAIRKIRDVAAEAIGVFRHMALSPQQRHSLTLARQPVLSDPFSVPQTSSAGGSPAGGSSASLRGSRGLHSASGSLPASGMPRYTGYIQAGTHRLAIIDNMEYREGDSLRETGDRVQSISEERVILYSPLRKSEWELIYLGDNLGDNS